MLRDLQTVVNLLSFLGFVLNYDKSVTTPQQIMDYLGVVVDSLLSFSLPSAKVDSIIALCKSVLVSSKVKLRDLAKLMGNFSWSISSVPFAQGHFRKLQHFYLSHSHGDLAVSVSLSHGAKSDLEWWVTHLQQSNGKSFFPDQPDLVIFSDAPLNSWGLYVTRHKQEALGQLRISQGTLMNQFWHLIYLDIRILLQTPSHGRRWTRRIGCFMRRRLLN